MAASGGGIPPTPPKRPTINRQANNADNDGETPIPSRPAPPLPGARPPGRSPPGVPARPTENIPVRPSPPTPSRPDTRPKSMPPPKPAVTPADKSQGSLTNGKRRPEITIVSARPMSEVGFRENKSSVGAEPDKLTGNKADEGNGHPPQRSPRLSPRFDSSPKKEDTSPNDAATRPSRGPPPPVPRPSVRPGRPSVSPRGGAVDSSELQSDQHKQHPSPEGSQKDDNNPPMPRGAPPPVPRNLSLSQRPLPKVPPQSNKPETSDAFEVPNKVTNESSLEQEQDHISDSVKDSFPTDPVYCVINKPKRPTIIRPGRSNVKMDLEDKHASEEIKKPSASPQMMKTESESINKDCAPAANKMSVHDGPGNSEDNVPEFLKMKLKHTVDDTTGRDKADEGKISQPVTRGPPPPMKPKPSVKPKPNIAAKPSIASKPSLPQTATATFAEHENVVKPSNDEVKNPKVDNEGPTDIHVNISKPAGFKRPTIIRPGRPVQSTSTENISKNTDIDTIVTKHDISESVHDDSVTLRSRPQPPLPSKRPVSMTNIPQAIAQEVAATSGDLPASKSLHLHSSAESMTPSTQPKPNPRPTPRARPASMMVPSAERPPVPASAPKLGSGSPKLSSDAGGTHESKEKAELPSHKSVPGVQVLPVIDKHKTVERDSTGPAKPARRPPPPKAGPKKSADSDSSSSDDNAEFVLAQTKPDRPSGPPHRPSPLPARKDVDTVEMRPPRPGAVPPPRKSSIKADEEHDSEAVKMRPARPESRPPRPVSIPGKIDQPSRPKLPQPSPVAVTKSGESPSLPPRPSPGHPLYHYMMQVPHGIATHDYTARDKDELTFVANDVIVLTRGVDADWLVGRVDDQEGMFPRNFIHVKRPLPGEEHLKVEKDSTDESGGEAFDTAREKPDHLGHGPRCRARFDFEGQGPDDLTFEDGDIIRLLERVGDEWRRGECDGRVGLFPLTYVEMIEDLPEENIEESIAGKSMATAVYDFEGEPGDLQFQSGERIHVLYQVNSDWLFGETDGRKGQFPKQFVDHVPSDLPPPPDSQSHDEANLQPSVAQTDLAADHLSGAVWDDVPEPKQEQVSPTPPIESEEPYCIALYDYPGDSSEDLTFNVGDKITLVQRIDADWLKGELDGNTGLFPAAFVEVKKDIAEIATESSTLLSSPDQSNSEPNAIAMHDFTGEADNELTFSAGEKLLVQETVEGADGWSWGVLDGRRGIFPTAFVSVEE